MGFRRDFSKNVKISVMQKWLILICFITISIFGNAQVNNGTGLCYTSGVPIFTPTTGEDCELVWDFLNQTLYCWDRNTNSWQNCITPPPSSNYWDRIFLADNGQTLQSDSQGDILSVDGGEGIRFGGIDVAGSELLSGTLDFDGLTEETSFDPINDYLAFYDASAVVHRKISHLDFLKLANGLHVESVSGLGYLGGTLLESTLVDAPVFGGTTMNMRRWTNTGTATSDGTFLRLDSNTPTFGLNNIYHAALLFEGESASAHIVQLGQARTEARGRTTGDFSRLNASSIGQITMEGQVIGSGRAGKFELQPDLANDRFYWQYTNAAGTTTRMSLEQRVVGGFDRVIINVSEIPSFASDAAASAGGLQMGDLYADGTGNVRIKL